MIATELGLTFEREDDHWRCREHPELLMFPDGHFGIAGQPVRYVNAASALAARPRPDNDRAT
jgi:hypothetical protein